MSEAKKQKLWGGRFTGATDPVMEVFNNSIDYDKIMWEEDINGSIAYAAALADCRIVTADEKNDLVEGLKKVKGEWERKVAIAIIDQVLFHTVLAHSYCNICTGICD